jgi:hypothetical protein
MLLAIAAVNILYLMNCLISYLHALYAQTEHKSLFHFDLFSCVRYYYIH